MSVESFDGDFVHYRGINILLILISVAKLVVRYLMIQTMFWTVILR